MCITYQRWLYAQLDSDHIVVLEIAWLQVKYFFIKRSATLGGYAIVVHSQ
ncbi:MAG TPA: hypothetical protein IGS40_16410 [Trichormus sp. M33_DOE_039]|nr:hypothetical protein [Trichormus sp. M33_DOE_039]